MRNIACIDIGGTFIKYGVINEVGEVLLTNKFPLPDGNCKKIIPEKLIKVIKELQLIYNIDAVGVSTAGQVDSEKGEIIFASGSFPGFGGTKLSEEIRHGTGLGCFVENDVNAAAIGEMWKGAGRNKDTFICLTIGTGIGAALVIHGKVYKGVGNCAGEAGHMIINEGGKKCGFGMRGCYEKYGSTSSLIRNYAEKTGIDINCIKGEEIMKRVITGEEVARQVYDEFLNHIVIGLINLTHILDPGLFIIGGGISAQGNSFFKEINKRFAQAVIPSYARYTKIVPSELKNDAGLFGACLIAL